MVVDFSRINIRERPKFILKSLDDKPLSYLGFALEPTLSLCYNEISQLQFDYPSYVDGKKTDAYNLLVGMRLIDIQGYGQFVLMNPVTEDDGITAKKSCKAYSLEFEFTYKNISLEDGTYNFWNPVAPQSTILGMIMEDMPSWSVGYVSPSLVGKYRTYSVNDVNIYDLIKSTLQETYGCIFEFDTYKRTVNVRDVNDTVLSTSVFLSTKNLIKDIEITEDTESVVTALDVYGAEEVTVRSVNPMGINRIYNLDAYMNQDNFSQDMIDRWQNWKATFSSYQLPYYNLTVEQALQVSRYETEYAALATLQGELINLETQQATIIQAIANNLSPQSDLTAINQKISQKQSEIASKNSLLSTIKNNITNLTSQLEVINKQTALSKFFNESELIILDRYFKCGSITDNTFVASEVQTYATEDVTKNLASLGFSIDSSKIDVVNYTSTKTFYSIRTGNLNCTNLSLTAEIISGTLEVNTDKSFVFSVYLNVGKYSGDSFPSATFSATGTITTVANSATSLSFSVSNTNIYLTKSVTEYQKKSIEWELFEYGQESLLKLCYPSYSFSVSGANFLALDEFVSFTSQFKLGERVYLEIENKKILEPIVVGVEIDFDDLSSFTMKFGDTFNLDDSSFKLVDLLEQSISMGKSLNFSKYNYSSFVNSGASTKVEDFMQSALDVGKNNILSSTGQAITWDGSGLRLRKWTDDTQSAYEPKQIWMANNSIMFTQDSWQSAVIGIGEFSDKNLGSCYGIVAPNIVGTLLAGTSLIIESVKQDGGVAVFKVDAEGASLHNASFDLYGTSGGRINLDPMFGILGGQASNMFTYNSSTGQITGVQTKNGRSISRLSALATNDSPNPNFWLDMNGDIYLRGTVYATDGEFTGTVYANAGSFSGTVTATDFYFKNGNSVKTLLSATANKTQIDPEFLNLKGLTISNGSQVTFAIDSNGNVTTRGNITMTGGTISWSNVNTDPATTAAQNRADNAYSYAADAYSYANSAYSSATNAADLARRIANGTFSGGTFIDGTSIYSPTIYSNEFIIHPRTVGNNVGGYSIYGYFGSQLMHMFKLGYYAGDAPYVTFDSPVGAYAAWNFGRTIFRGSIDFSSANVTGLTATFA